ncbi:unnamed protein product [Anisakis simplex]|uniref:Homeobox domain-containing protein n=1 Tax=Anisakis simplex TaxID=6269 RepID=A0A0M3JTX0_ANISI|nr:unnamed protein product [Anisakis simplex]
MAACISTNQHPIGSLSTKASPDTNVMLTDVINASDKAKIHQQAELLDMWIALHGDNFYPRRKEKEKIAKELCMSYLQVNRWFANRRRKQTKKRKDEMLMTSSSHFTQPHSSSSSISNDNFKNNADE